MLLALLVRLAFLQSIQRSIYAQFLFWDEQTYDAWAKALVHGAPFSVYDQSSLPAYVMAIVYRLNGEALVGVRLLNVAWGVFTCGLAWAIGRELRGPIAGLITGATIALYRPFALLNVTLLKESLGLCLWALTLYLFLRGLRKEAKRGPWLLFALGGATALLLNLRQNMVVAVPVLAAVPGWTAFQRTRTLRPALGALVAFAGGLVLLLAPFAAMTYRETGQVSPTPVGGFNLYLGNNLASGVPFYRPVPFATSNPQEHAVHFTVEASRRTGRRLTGGEASSFWTGEVIRTAAERPARFARHLGLKALAVLNRWEEADNHDLTFLADYIPALRAPLLSFGLVLPFGLAAILVLAWSRDRAGVAFAVLFAAYAATMIVVFPNMRVRAPLVLLLVPAAVACGVDLARGYSRTRAVAIAACVGVLSLVARLSLPGCGDFTGALNAHAINLQLRGDLDGAHEYWSRSAAARGAYSNYAFLGLGFEQLARGNPDAARQVSDRISDDSFAAFNKYDLIADAWMASGDPARAAEALRRSLEFDSANRHVHQKLIAALSVFDAPGAERERENLAALQVFFAPSQRGAQ